MTELVGGSRRNCNPKYSDRCSGRTKILQVKSIENKRISSINAYHAKALIFSLGIEIKFSVRENVRD